MRRKHFNKKNRNNHKNQHPRNFYFTFIFISYLKPERLDVYRGDVYIHPNNNALNDDGKFITLPPPADDPEKYYPKLNSSKSFGVNVFTVNFGLSGNATRRGDQINTCTEDMKEP